MKNEIISIALSKISTEGRHRKDLGDIEALANSIEDIGLLHPVVVCAVDEQGNYKLIAGERRLAAFKLLNERSPKGKRAQWVYIPATVADNFNDIAKALHAERDENTCRKDFAPSEVYALGQVLEPIERAEAAKRQATLNNTETAYGKFPQATGKGETRDKVGKALGVSGKTLDKINEVATFAQEHAMPELVELMDTKSVDAAHKKVKAEKRKAKQKKIEEQAQEEKPIAETPPRSVKRGDVWQLGKHRVMCGDAYSEHDMRQLLQGVTPDALITDPPYGIDYRPDWNKWDGSPSDYRKVIGDDEYFNPTQFLAYPTVAMFGANYFSDSLPLGGWLCWDKRLDAEKDAMFGSPFELAWFRSQHTTRKAIMVRVLHGGVVNADSVNGNNEKRYHATQKPVEVMAQVIDELTKPHEIIIDPFAGSGSTLLACQILDRVSLSMEIDPAYVEIIIARWETKTGDKAWLV